ncbi:MAG TPA: hypothetical protein VK879_16370 [Candidatus Sulfomarinibacteraceae bacterium]|nr:hypothetical protein [Candidatus Sulfomarinibacteraceae bacterium]
MVRRLVDLYHPGDRVEIFIERAPTQGWMPGQVTAHAFPGVWVQTDSGQRWFVTNRRRIRPLTHYPDAEER